MASREGSTRSWSSGPETGQISSSLPATGRAEGSPPAVEAPRSRNGLTIQRDGSSLVDPGDPSRMMASTYYEGFVLSNGLRTTVLP